MIGYKLIGYKFNTEQEAILARQLGANYIKLPKPNGATMYWYNYNYSELDEFWYIQYSEGVEVVLGQPIEFEITINEII